METPMNDDSDDGNGGGGNTVLNIITIHVEMIWLHLIRKWVYLAHSFVITEPCNICLQLWHVLEQLLCISSTEAKP